MTKPIIINGVDTSECKQLNSDKEALIKLAERLVDEISKQNHRINELTGIINTFQSLIDKQFQLLCSYANICKNSVEDGANGTNYTNLKSLLSEYGENYMSLELLNEVNRMIRNYEGFAYEYQETNND